VVVDEDYRGPARILACTVMYDREGAPERGAVVGTGARGERVAARVDDPDTLHELASGVEPVGREGIVTIDAVPVFAL
jgi:hypothetical protein